MLSFDSGELLRELMTLKPFAATRTSLPVLAGVHIRKDKKGPATLTATNLETALVTQAEATGDVDAFCLDIREAITAVQFLGPGPVSMRYHDELVWANIQATRKEVREAYEKKVEAYKAKKAEWSEYTRKIRMGEEATEPEGREPIRPPVMEHFRTPVTISHETSGAWVKLEGMEPDDFPTMPDISREWFTTTAPEVSRHVASFQHSAASDDSRPTLAGVRLSLNGEGKAAYATADGFRMNVTRVAIGAGAEAATVIIPVKSARLLARTMKRSTAPVTVKLTEMHRPAQMAWSWSGRTVISRLIDGAFPSPEAIMPTDALIADEYASVSVELGALESVMARVDRMMPRNMMSRLQVTEDGQVRIDSRAAGSGMESRTYLPGHYHNREVPAFTLNTSYVRDALLAMIAFGLKKTDMVTILKEQSGRDTAAVLRPYRQEEGESFTEMIMPMVVEGFGEDEK